ANGGEAMSRNKTFALAVVILALLAAVIATVIFYRNPLDPLDAGRYPVSDAFIGEKKEAILSRYGPPSDQWEGHYGNPKVQYGAQVSRLRGRAPLLPVPTIIERGGSPHPEVHMTLTLEVDLPADLARFQLPEAVAARLQSLLDRQDSGQPLTPQEREEAEGLVSLAEVLTLLRLRAERLAS